MTKFNQSIWLKAIAIAMVGIFTLSETTWGYNPWGEDTSQTMGAGYINNEIIPQGDNTDAQPAAGFFDGATQFLNDHWQGIVGGALFATGAGLLLMVAGEVLCATGIGFPLGAVIMVAGGILMMTEFPTGTPVNNPTETPVVNPPVVNPPVDNSPAVIPPPPEFDFNADPENKEGSTPVVLSEENIPIPNGRSFANDVANTLFFYREVISNGDIAGARRSVNADISQLEKELAKSPENWSKNDSYGDPLYHWKVLKAVIDRLDSIEKRGW